MVQRTYAERLHLETREQIAPVVQLLLVHETPPRFVCPQAYAARIVDEYLSMDYENDRDREAARFSAVAILSGVLDGDPKENFATIEARLIEEKTAENVIKAVGNTALDRAVEAS